MKLASLILLSIFTPVYAEMPRECHTQVCVKSYLHELANENIHQGNYTVARTHMFQEIDDYIDNSQRYVDSVYTPDRFLLPEKGIPLNIGVNTEHVYPQSWLKVKADVFAKARCDIYNLYPVLGTENSRRNNRPYAECGGAKEKGILCKAGYEPPDKQKGKSARSIFYMAITYGYTVENTMETILKKWNDEFPPTQEEINRGEKILKIQGNVNPFIENHHYVDEISDF